MKKLTLGLAVLLSSYAASTLAAMPVGSSRCDVSAPSYCGGFTFSLTGLYWRPTSPDLDFVTTFDNIDFNDLIGIGNAHTHHHNHEYDWGFKASIGYVFPCSGNDVNLTYTHWDNDNSEHAKAVAIPPEGSVNALIVTGPTIPFQTVAPPNTAHPAILPIIDILNDENFKIDDFAATVSSTSSFENHTWDLDFGQNITAGCNFRLRWFGGVRYTRLEHKQTTTFDTHFAGKTSTMFGIEFQGDDLIPVNLTDDFDGKGEILVDLSSNINEIFDTRSKFEGVGPRIGLDASYNIGFGFGIVGSISTSLLVGEVDSSLTDRVSVNGTSENLYDNVESDIIVNGLATEVDPAEFTSALSFNPGVNSFHHPDETRVVPNIDAKLGLDYTFQFNNCSRSKVTIEAGYLMSQYFNPIDRLSLRSLTDPESNTRHTQNVSFDGPYISINVAL